jgi:hypothetical protein
MNKIVSSAVAIAVGVGLVFGLTACGGDNPPKDFKQACDDAGGNTERDHDSLGMGSVAFEKPAPKSNSKSSKTKTKSSKSKSEAKTGTINKLPQSTSTSKSKKSKKKSKKSDDNEWVCMKNGVEIFDED